MTQYYEGVRIKEFGNRKEKTKNNEFKGVRFKKSLGQNFLNDKDILTFISDSAQLVESDNVLEIGAGAGTLSEVLAKRSGKVISYEVDMSLKQKLGIVESQNKNLNFVFKDFMMEDLSNIFFDEKYKVVANIPYYITTPIIFKLVEDRMRIDCMIFMVQKEVAERLSARENNREYGVPSVVLQSIANVEYLKTVDKKYFTPIPKVDSAIIKITFVEKYDNLDLKLFSKFVHLCFSMRRKTLVNNLQKLDINIKNEIYDILQKLGYNDSIRPEQISIDNYIKLFKLLKSKIN